MKEDKLTKLQNFVMSLFKQEIQLSEIKSKDGYTFMSPDEEISIGSEIYQIDAEGNKVPLVGEVEILSEDGKVYKTNDGKVIEIEMMEEKPEDEMETPEIEMEAEVELEVQTENETEVELEIETETKIDSEPVVISLEDRMSALEKRFEDLISSTEKVAEFSKELSLSLEDIKKIPASSSIKINVNPNRELTPTELRFERIKAIKNNI